MVILNLLECVGKSFSAGGDSISKQSNHLKSSSLFKNLTVIFGYGN